MAFFTLEMDYPSLGAFDFKSVFQKNMDIIYIMYMQRLCCKFRVLWFFRPLKNYTCTYIGILHFIKIFSYREVSCCHGSKSSGWQQTENITEKVNSHCFKLHWSYSISFCVKCWWNFLGLNLRGPYLSLKKEKKYFGVVFTYSMKQAYRIRTFHVAVVQWRLRNVKKNVMHGCFVN